MKAPPREGCSVEETVSDQGGKRFRNFGILSGNSGFGLSFRSEGGDSKGLRDSRQHPEPLLGV